LADLLLSARRLRDVPTRWAPVYHASLVLTDPLQLPLVIGGEKGQGPFWDAPLITYEDVFQAGHVDFDYSVVQVLIAGQVQYTAMRDRLRQARDAIEARGYRYDPFRANCNAVVTTLLSSLGYPLPRPPLRGWLPGYGRVILTEV
jgi:hypothetical protein